MGSNSDSSQININRPGTYIVTASPAVGCPATRKDTIVIPLDTFPPVASIIAGIAPGFSYLQFYGGDLNASNYSTPFGGSQGLLWNWSGPNGFTSTIQNPTNSTNWGTYQLIVKEKRNGCTDTAKKTLNYWDFSVLAGNYLILKGEYSNNAINLNWDDKGQINTDYYEVEKSVNGTEFNRIGAVFNSGNPAASAGHFTFQDDNPGYGNTLYHIKAVTKAGEIYYSNIIKLTSFAPKKFYLSKSTSGSGLTFVSNTDNNYKGSLVLFNFAGKRLMTKNIQLNRGTTVIELPVNDNLRNSVIVVSLFINNQIAYSQKTIL